jgi:DNA-directed RNA polymerase subunit L
MAKKKKSESDEDLDEIDALESQEIESIYPTMSKTEEREEEGEIESMEMGEIGEEELEEEFGVPIEEEEEEKKYKYVDVSILEGKKENDYEVRVIGQSHGFCNVLVKHLLNMDGVILAAYKDTNLNPSQIFIRLEDGYKIKEILRQSISSLREEVLEVQELFKKLV